MNGLNQIIKPVILLSSSKQKKSDKRIDAVEKDNNVLRHEIMQLRNSETNLTRRITELSQSIDRLGMIFEWHSHTRIIKSGDVIFRRDEFEQATGIKLDDSLHPIQQEPIPENDQGE